MTDKKSLVVAALWTLALLFALPLIRPFEYARLAEYGAVFALLLAATHFSWVRGIEWKSPAIIAALLFWGFAVASLAWSPALTDSLVLLGTFSVLPVTFIVFSSRSIPASFYRYCAYGAGIVAGALAAWALIQYFFLPQFLQNYRPGHPFSDSNSYAAFLSLAFFGGIGGMMAGRNKIGRNLSLILAILTLGAIIVLGGRGPIIALVGGLLVFSVLMRGQFANHKRCTIALILGVAAITALAFIFSPDGSSVPFERLASPAEWQDAGRRLPLWLSALAMASDHLPLGTGFGTFFLYYPQYRSTADWYSSGLTAHNDMLQILSELGPAGLILFAVFLICAIARMVRGWKNLDDAPEQKKICFALFCGLGAMVLHGQLNFNLSIASVLLLSGMMMAAWHRLCLKSSEDASNEKSQTPALLLITLPMMLLLAASSACVVGQSYIREAKSALKHGNIEKFTDRVNMANAVTYGQNPRAYILASGIPLSILFTERINMMDRNDERRQMFAQAIDLLERAEKVNPLLPSVYYNRALLIDQMPLSVSGAAPDAREQALLKTLAVDPQHVDARMDLAKIYWKRGESQKAYGLLKAAETWQPLMGQVLKKYRLALAGLAQENGDTQAAERIYKLIEDEQKGEGVTRIPDFTPESDFVQPGQ